MALFVAEGYEKTTIRNIADKIEYSPATIYLHFKDKNELLFAVHEMAFEKFFNAMAPVLLISDIRQRLMQMGYIYVQFAFENPELYGLMFMDHAPMDCLEQTDSAWIAGMKAHNLLRDTVAQMLASQQISNEHEIDLLSLSIWSYVHGLTSLAIRDRLCILKEKDYALDEVIQKSLEIMIEKFLPKN